MKPYRVTQHIVGIPVQPELFGKYPDLNFSDESQTGQLYKHFKTVGAITTQDLHRMGMDTARIRDLRGALRDLKEHYDIECKTIPGVKNNRLYVLRG
jgi:hypothetical protein